MVTTTKNFTDVISWLKVQKKKFGHQQISTFIAAIRVANKHYKFQVLQPTTTSIMEHVLQCAEKVADMGLKADAVVASILYSIPKFCQNWHLELLPFGQEVIDLIKGINRVDSIKKINHNLFTSNSKKNIEVVRTMLLAMASDIRSVIIVLIGRGELMLNLNSCNNQDKIIQIAQTTMSIFAPLANRLGLWQIKWELEDIAFKFLHRKEYQTIAKLLDSSRLSRLSYLQQIENNLTQQIKKAGIKNFKLYGRAKHIYSIWNKMKNKNYSFEDLYDVLAIRVIVNTISECYAVLGITHSYYLPINKEFNDYIATPKNNHYQSLHTCVKTDEGISVEIQIRTKEMHENAEYGIAAHWKYKESEIDNIKFEQKISWVRRILDLDKKDNLSSSQISQIFKNEVFTDKIYVISPKGQVINLPAGSSVIDFAYYIHHDVGLYCQQAKVDNEVVPLSTVLQNGQTVEVICGQKPIIKLSWVYNKVAITKKAKNAIKRYFKQLDS